MKTQNSKLVWLLVVGWSLVIGHWSFALTDPTLIGVGARAMGMGRAYTAIAENGEALFTNPAGLGNIDSPKLSSMQTNLLNDINYLSIGGAYPYSLKIGKGALGIGYINMGTTDIVLRDSTGTITSNQGVFGSSVIFLSGGIQPSAKIDNLLIGGNLKIYSSNSSGSGAMEQGNGSGMDVDLGVLFSPKPWLTLGLVSQNLLPGNNIKYHLSGYEEEIANTNKIGAGIKIRDNWKIALDAELTANRPTTLHLGTEFWPVKVLALRAGLDENYLTAGIGIRYQGIEFNYAYHPYSELGEDTSHYFSLGYLGKVN